MDVGYNSLNLSNELSEESFFIIDGIVHHRKEGKSTELIYKPVNNANKRPTKIVYMKKYSMLIIGGEMGLMYKSDSLQNYIPIEEDEIFDFDVDQSEGIVFYLKKESYKTVNSLHFKKITDNSNSTYDTIISHPHGEDSHANKVLFVEIPTRKFIVTVGTDYMMKQWCLSTKQIIREICIKQNTILGEKIGNIRNLLHVGEHIYITKCDLLLIFDLEFKKINWSYFDDSDVFNRDSMDNMVCSNQEATFNCFKNIIDYIFPVEVKHGEIYLILIGKIGYYEKVGEGKSIFFYTVKSMDISNLMVTDLKSQTIGVYEKMSKISFFYYDRKLNFFKIAFEKFPITKTVLDSKLNFETYVIAESEKKLNFKMEKASFKMNDSELCHELFINFNLRSIQELSEEEKKILSDELPHYTIFGEYEYEIKDILSTSMIQPQKMEKIARNFLQKKI